MRYKNIFDTKFNKIFETPIDNIRIGLTRFSYGVTQSGDATGTLASSLSELVTDVDQHKGTEKIKEDLIINVGDFIANNINSLSPNSFLVKNLEEYADNHLFEKIKRKTNEKKFK